MKLKELKYKVFSHILWGNPKQHYKRKWKEVKLKRKHKRSVLDTHEVEAINQAINTIEPSQDKRVYIFQHQFFDKSGTKYFSGGAERYCCDLAKIFKDMGYTAFLIQIADTFWQKTKDDLHVLGLKTSPADYPFLLSYLNKAALSIYSGFSYWGGREHIHKPNILISHGITWDTPYYNADLPQLHHIMSSFEHIVSVDVNTISYLRASFGYYLSQRKIDFQYIPNYVDIKKFFPKARTSQRVKITYPRRLSNERGFWLFAENISSILDKYPHVDVEFVGFVHGKKINNYLKSLEEKYPDRITQRLVASDKMNEVYQNTDISVIPTLYAEGTSLSCLEAMACGNSIVSTNIGGLANIIIKDFNGKLVNPNAQEFFAAICEILDDTDHFADLKTNAVAVAQKFSKEIWEERWKKVVTSTINQTVSQKLSAIINQTNKNILFASDFEYTDLTQRPQHILHKLNHSGYTILWPSTKVDDVVEIKDNFYLFPLPELETILQEGKIEIINLYLHHYPIQNFEKILKSDNLKNTLFLAEYVDDFAIVKDKQIRTKIEEITQVCLQHEKTIFLCTTEDFCEHIKRVDTKNHQIIHSPNAVNVEDFLIQKQKNLPEDMKSVVQKKKKIIGYYGAMCDDWFDYKLFENLIRSNPDLEFICIGPITGKNEQKLHKYKNYTHIPPIKYTDIPKYASLFDGAIIPFQLNEITQNTSPVKLFEYMAMGLPIVTTSMQECQQYESVFIAENTKEFNQKLKQAIKAKTNRQYQTLLKKEANENTWSSRVDVILKAINEN